MRFDLRTDRGENDEKEPSSKGQKAKSAVLFGSNVVKF